jgi:biotin transport system substrate-specific component|tara:strand:- start:165 stop:713 length:549 start_codon:yes stop_codon:yes gene_type:complete
MEAIKNLKLEKIVKLTTILILGTILLAISAKTKIPFYPVPMTMQTFVVLFLGIALGYRIAVATVALYLFEGLMGIPVFASGGGWVYFTGPTTGYLIGFIFSTFFAGYLKLNVDPLIVLLKLIFSLSFIYLFGLIWLGAFNDWEKSFFEIFEMGAKPFLLAESYKVLILAILSNSIIKIRKIT